MSEHPNNIRKHGSKICCDALMALLKAKNASVHVIDAFEAISLTRQIALSDGIVFSGREIFRRNEFVSGDFIVIGARRDYAFYVTNLRTGGVGLIPSHEESDSIPRETVECLGLRFADFLSASCQTGSQSDSTYVVPEYFNVDEIAVMQMLSDCCLGSVVKTPETFRRWIHDVGVPKNFCFCDFVPMEEMLAGACVIFPHKQIAAVNYEMRRRINPHYLVIGSCPDGNLVVLDIRRSVPSIGYVSIEEAGDEKSWDDYYVLVSQTLGSFLHDTNFLGILPDDYYQAKARVLIMVYL